MFAVAYFNPDRPSYLLDPYPALARLRAEEPVHWSPRLEAWVVTSYRHCAEALYDPERFGSAPPEATYDASAPRPLVKIDGADHDRLRAVVAHALTPRAVSSAAARLRETVAELVAAWPDNEPFEFVSGLAAPAVQCAVTAYAGVDPELSVEAAREFTQSAARGEFDGHAFDGTLRSPRPGSLAEAVAAGAALGQLTRREAAHLLADILSAGSDATAYALGNAVATLCSDAEAYASIGHEIEPAAAVEELLRYDSSTQAVARRARRDTSLGGAKIAAGDELMLMVGAANRDPDAFEHADELQLGRSPNRHLSFAVGMHYCLGAPLARQIIAETLGQIRSRFRTLTLGPGGGERRGNFALRGFASLEVIGAAAR